MLGASLGRTDDCDFSIPTSALNSSDSAAEPEDACADEFAGVRAGLVSAGCAAHGPAGLVSPAEPPAHEQLSCPMPDAGPLSQDSLLASFQCDAFDICSQAIRDLHEAEWRGEPGGAGGSEGTRDVEYSGATVDSGDLRALGSLRLSTGGGLVAGSSLLLHSSPAAQRTSIGGREPPAVGAAHDDATFFVGFATAGGRRLGEPSDTAKARARTILQQCDIDAPDAQLHNTESEPFRVSADDAPDAQLHNTESELFRVSADDAPDAQLHNTESESMRVSADDAPDAQLHNTESESVRVSADAPPAFAGFTTAGGRALPEPTDAAKARAAEVLAATELAQDENDTEKYLSVPTHVGFQTAGGRALNEPSSEARKRAAAILVECGDQEPEEQVDGAPMPGFAGFATAGGRRLEAPSADAVARAASLLADVRDEAERSTTLHAASSGFATAGGRRIAEPSDEAKARAAAILQETCAAPAGSASASATPESVPLVTPPPSAPKRPRTAAIGVGNGSRPFKAPSLLDPHWRPKATQPPKPAATVRKAHVPSARVFDLDTVPQGRIALSSLRPPHEGAPVPHVPSFEDVVRLVGESLPLASGAWLRNHYAEVVLKLCGYARMHDAAQAPPLSAASVRDQLFYRYEREYRRAQRSVLRRACERDGPAGALMVLYVAEAAAQPGGRFRLVLSDGWYRLGTVHDAAVDELAARGRLRVGTKVAVCCAQVVADEAVDVLEADERGVQLRIHGNAARPAPWHARLGRQRAPGGLFRVPLGSVRPDGGAVPCVAVRVARRYAPIFLFERGGERWSVAGEAALEAESARLPGDGSVRVRMAVRVRVVAHNADDRTCAVVTLHDASAETHAMAAPGAALNVFNTKPGRPLLSRDGRILHLVGYSGSRILPIPEAGPCESLTAGDASNAGDSPETQDLREHDETAVSGWLLSAAGEYVWLLPARCAQTDAGLADVVAVRKARRLPPIADAPRSALRRAHVSLGDVVFEGRDPRMGFGVFGAQEHSVAVVALRPADVLTAARISTLRSRVAALTGLSV